MATAYETVDLIVSKMPSLLDEDDPKVYNAACHSLLFMVGMEYYKQYGKPMFPGCFIKGQNHPEYIDEEGFMPFFFH